MRLDYWFFQGYLLGMGSLTELKEYSHGAIELAVSFNNPMKVTVGGESCECSSMAIGPHTPHVIDGRDGWQFFGYLHPESTLGKLILDKIDRGGGLWLHNSVDLSHLEAITPSLNNEPSAYKVRELWEFLLSHLLGIKSFSLGWSIELKNILLMIENIPLKELNLKNLADQMELPSTQIEERFFQLAGIPLLHFIFNRKLVNASLLIKKHLTVEKAIEESGLSGVASAKTYIKNLYGLDMEYMLTEKPHVRFFSAGDFEQLSGHAI